MARSSDVLDRTAGRVTSPLPEACRPRSTNSTRTLRTVPSSSLLEAAAEFAAQEVGGT